MKQRHHQGLRPVALALACALVATPAATQTLPETGPVPAERPSSDQAPEPVAEPMPPAEQACRARLDAMSVGYAEHPPIDEPGGCVALHPVLVETLPGDVALRPPAVLTCAMAEATALYVRDHAAPATRAVFGASLATIDQVSSYVCRARRAGDKLSEHARANALDWGALELGDGTTVEIVRHRRIEPRRARLVGRLRDAACGPFTTVLGPGTDSDHADHFHFDLAERRSGGAYCR